jgi:hypothetical protein
MDIERDVRRKLIRINKYLAATQNNERSIGIHTGLSGECLMVCLNYLAFESAESETRIYEILDLLNRKIETGKTWDGHFRQVCPDGDG